jgi:hypothetical protein
MGLLQNYRIQDAQSPTCLLSGYFIDGIVLEGQDALEQRLAPGNFTPAPYFGKRAVFVLSSQGLLTLDLL